MKKRDRFAPPAIGAGALLTAFSVLVLCVFALLSLSTARAQARLSQVSAQTTAAYYAADTQAEQIFAQLRAGQLPPNVQTQDDLYFYTCPVADTQTLAVTLRQENGTWNILQWQVVAADVPAADYTPQLWLGGSP